MLFDQIINEDGPLKLIGDLSEIRRRITMAQKFVISPDFAQAADELASQELSVVRKLYPFAKSPFAEAWFEVLHSDRQLFKDAPMDGGTVRPHRIGFLLRCSATNPGGWKCQLFWSSGTVWITSILACEFDGTSLDTKPSEFFNFGNSLMQKMLRNRLEAAAIYDWGGEGGYIVAALALLNSRNVAALEFVDRSKMNRKRLGFKPPKNSFHILRIDGRLKNKMEGGGSGAHLRAHFVSGHFKVRKTGVFWWAPFTRGDLSLGFVSKIYHVAGRR